MLNRYVTIRYIIVYFLFIKKDDVFVKSVSATLRARGAAYGHKDWSVGKWLTVSRGIVERPHASSFVLLVVSSKPVLPAAPSPANPFLGRTSRRFGEKCFVWFCVSC